MDTSLDTNTQLLIKHGNPQVQPLKALQLNQNHLVPFRSRTDSFGSINSGYRVLLTGYANYILFREINMDQFYERLENLLTSLRGNPRSLLSAKKLKGSVDTYRIKNTHYSVDYRIANGIIEVYNIELVDRQQIDRDKRERPALYHVKRNNQGLWEASFVTAQITTRFAAVNGQSNNLAKATWLMGAHLTEQYGSLNEYTLYHNPSSGGKWDTWESLRDKVGFTTPVTKQFAKALYEAQKSGQSTQWVAHSQGGVIFAEAVRYLLNDSSPTAFNRCRLNGLRNPEKGSLLDKHSIAMHGNANNNMRSKILFNRAGIKVIPGQANDYDFVHNIIGMNSLNIRKIFGSLIYARHVFSGSVLQSPHTLAQSQASWQKNMGDTTKGRGRSLIQQGFNSIDQKKVGVVKAPPNYLP